MAQESAFLKAPLGFYICPDLRTTLSIIQTLYLLERILASVRRILGQKEHLSKREFVHSN